MERFPVLGSQLTKDDNLVRRSNLVGLSFDDSQLKRRLKPQDYRYLRWEPCLTNQSSTADRASDLRGLRVDILRHGHRGVTPGSPRAARVSSKTYVKNGTRELFESKPCMNPRQAKNTTIRDTRDRANDENYSCRNFIKTKVSDKFHVHNSFVVAADKISLLLQSAPPFDVRGVSEAKSGRAGGDIRHLANQYRGNNRPRESSPWSRSPLGTRLYLPRRFLPANCKLNGLYRANTFAAPSRSGSQKYTGVTPIGGTAGRIVLRGINIDQSHQNHAEDVPSTHNNWCDPLLPSSTSSVDNTVLTVTNTPTPKVSGMKSMRSTGEKHAIKTLSPSKHGYHPRSTSPTFKILVCASERLRESELNPSARVSKDKVYYTDSPEPGRGAPQSFNSTEGSDTTGSVSSRSETDFQRLRRKSGHVDMNILSLNKIQVDRTNTHFTRINRHLPQAEHSKTNNDVSNDTEATSNAREEGTVGNIIHEVENIEEQIDKVDQIENIGVFITLPAIEVEKENGQTTHMHFFLPQIVTSMSELSFTNYGEPTPGERTDLTRSFLFSNGQDTTSQPDTGDGFPSHPANKLNHPHPFKEKPKLLLPKQINVNDSDRNKPQFKRVHINPLARKTKQIRNVISSTKRPSVAQKGKPLAKQEPTAGRKEIRSPADSDHRLLSEKLKEEMEDFPTLVSMDFS